MYKEKKEHIKKKHNGEDFGQHEHLRVYYNL